MQLSKNKKLIILILKIKTTINRNKIYFSNRSEPI